LRITALMQSTDIIMVKHGEDCVALAKVDGHIVHPVRVFHLS